MSSEIEQKYIPKNIVHKRINDSAFFKLLHYYFPLLSFLALIMNLKTKYLLSSSIVLLFINYSTVANAATAVDPQSWYAQNPGMTKISLVDQTINQITDVFGRIRFFHGTNVVKKSAPWHRSLTFTPGDSFGVTDAANLQALGVNAIRLGHHWAGSEPIRGQYNQTFLDILKQQSKIAEDHGIYVLVDVHQDVLAAQLCGHGVPDVSALESETKY